MIAKQLFTLLVFGLLVTSCYKDTKTCRCAREPKFNFKNECKDAEQFIDEWDDGTKIDLSVTIHPKSERFKPCFNPLDAEEIAFVLKHRRDNDGDIAIAPHVVIANLNTGEHRFLLWLPQKRHDVPIAWGSTGFIAVGSSIGRIVNTATSEVIEFDPGVSINYPAWKSNGTAISGWKGEVFNDELKVEFENAQMITMEWPSLEMTGYKLNDEAFFFSRAVTSQWSANDELILRSKEEVGYWSMKTMDYTKVLNTDVAIGTGRYSTFVTEDFDWGPNESDIYFLTDDGIFMVSKGEDKQFRIKKSCPNRQYQHIAISPLGDKIVAQRRDIETENDGTYISENIKLVIMDINGCNEEILFDDWDGVVSGRP